jgi:transposase
MVTATLPDLNTLTLDALKALIVAQHERLLTREREVEHLKLLIARLQRMQFGRKSEKLAQQIEQLELRLEELQSEPGGDSSPEAKPSVLINKDTASAKPARHPLPGYLPRQTRRHEPKESACPDCGGVLRKLGEDVSEMLEYVPASFFVIRHVRPKLSCSHC